MIARYFAERFNPILFGPVALILALAAGAGRATPRQLALDVVFVLVALAHFRLWDDLADRRADAVTHPARVLVRAPSAMPFIAMCALLGAVALAMAFAQGGVALTVLLCLQVELAAWYALRRGHSAGGSLIVLSKYPLLLLATAGDRISLWPAPIAAAAVVAYAAACAYEAWHDPAAFSLGGH